VLHDLKVTCFGSLQDVVIKSEKGAFPDFQAVIEPAFEEAKRLVT